MLSTAHAWIIDFYEAKFPNEEKSDELKLSHVQTFALRRNEPQQQETCERKITVMEKVNRAHGV